KAEVVQGPTAENLWSLWGSGPADVWAVGTGGAIVHYDGTAWTSAPSPTTGTLVGCWGSGPTDVWAVGLEASGRGTVPVLLHFRGTAWAPDLDGLTRDLVTSLASVGLNAFLSVWGDGQGSLWIGAERGILRRQGTTWTIDSLLTSPQALWGTDA